MTFRIVRAYRKGRVLNHGTRVAPSLDYAATGGGGPFKVASHYPQNDNRPARGTVRGLFRALSFSEASLETFLPANIPTSQPQLKECWLTFMKFQIACLNRISLPDPGEEETDADDDDEDGDEEQEAEDEQNEESETEASDA